MVGVELHVENMALSVRLLTPYPSTQQAHSSSARKEQTSGCIFLVPD